ncbi:MAG: helix-turn-helix transcriptional regulator, partial [Proteobacteria bacterium]
MDFSRLKDLRPSILLILAAVAGFAVTGLEILIEEETTSIFEYLYDSLEKTLVLIGAGGVFLVLRQMRAEQSERQALRSELEIARVEGGAWRKKVQNFINGVGAEIDKQFDAWALSEAEREIALLMIKGLSHNEIADLRGTSEATVRQQARTIYQKSKLPGKAAFSAFFLEDLLPPQKEE